MHILIAIITAVGGLVWALVRLQNSGIDLSSFNPFFWARRRSWEKKHGTKPIHTIDDPMEAASVLVVAMAELKAPLTKEAKNSVLNSFVDEFKIDAKTATEMYTSSAYLLADVVNIAAEVKHILALTLSEFQERHIASLSSMLNLAATVEGSPSDEQQSLLKAVEHEFQRGHGQRKQW
ncbi:hypothetical protein [Gilvimarinus polysaccharolyticus]|uniref:hypothetical protein n=1 Tax=Gilvimarinus polysaccharolyticus TaxID=863921 RepID=UPI0006731F7B|nr:hypothetical protein [Gilvimarinus polysaccharolyticus]